MNKIYAKIIDELITVLAIITSIVLGVFVAPVMIIYKSLENIYPQKKQSLLEQCLKELIRRNIDFEVKLKNNTCALVHSDTHSPETFYIDFITENEVHYFKSHKILKLTTIEELLKIKPFTLD